jgi:hypothetical protein
LQQLSFIRLNERNLTLNKSKCEFNKDKLEFDGHIFGTQGISPYPKKVAAIKNAPVPKDVGEVRSRIYFEYHLILQEHC